MKSGRVFLAFFLFFFGVTAAFAQAPKNPLYERFSRLKEVRVYVAMPTAASSNLKADPSLFQKKLKDVLAGRKSVHFIIVESESEAQVKVASEILGYYFSQTDPVDMLAGVGMAAMDAAKKDHFASTEVNMSVSEGDVTLWSEKVRASVTDEKMSEADSYDKVFDKAAQMFVRQAFGKK